MPLTLRGLDSVIHRIEGGRARDRGELESVRELLNSARRARRRGVGARCGRGCDEGHVRFDKRLHIALNMLMLVGCGCQLVGWELAGGDPGSSDTRLI